MLLSEKRSNLIFGAAIIKNCINTAMRCESQEIKQKVQQNHFFLLKNLHEMMAYRMNRHGRSTIWNMEFFHTSPLGLEGGSQVSKRDLPSSMAMTEKLPTPLGGAGAVSTGIHVLLDSIPALFLTTSRTSYFVKGSKPLICASKNNAGTVIAFTTLRELVWSSGLSLYSKL